MFKVVEVNDNDIFGKVFNGYDIMENLNQDKRFNIKQLVLKKYSNNKNVIEFVPGENLFLKEYYLHNLEHDFLSVHSLITVSNEFIRRNYYYKNADLVHFHQVHNCHFSLDDFYDMAMTKPTIISLHDPWFATGRCVHPKECNKWKNGCKKCPNLDTFFDLPEDNCAELWKIKERIADTDIDLVVHSKFMYDLVKESPYLSKLRVHLIPFGVDVSKFTYDLTKEEAKKKLNIFPKDIVIFLRENKAFKGTEYALEALKKLDVEQNITILTCSETDQLIGLEDKFNVVKLGIIDEDKVRECYNAADLFLMPSPAESFGMMAVEAMASGVPTFVFDNTALPSTTGAPDYGILVKNLDSTDLCEKIKYYIEHPKELIKRGEISRKFVSDNYSPDEYYKKIKELYDDVYQKQKYKLNQQYKKNTSINYNDPNSQRLLKKLVEVSKNLFVNESNYPSLLSNYKSEDNKKIKFSDSNVLNIIKNFNHELYLLFLNKKIPIMEYEKKSSIITLPKVSIIIPVYNGEKYLSLAIDSALRQTYPNTEVIVVNDGSKDHTDKICRSYGNKIKYIKKENGGVSTALNVGIENMTGEYFSWLSHDDLYYPNKVEVEVDYLIKNKLLNTKTILYSDYSIIDEFGNFNYDVQFNSKYLNRDSIYPILFGAIDGLSLLIPKKAFDEVGYFDKNLRCVQDYQLWYEMYKAGYKYIHIPEVTVSTRIHSKQVTNTSPLVAIEGNKYWVDLLNDFSSKDRERALGSDYNFWYILHSFFVGGPYTDAIELCKNKYMKIAEKHKKDKPVVSVIVNLNGSTSSNLRCLKSLVDQTYKNVELIIYNNGKLKKFDVLNSMNKNNYKILESFKNSAVMWNDGIKKASGKYIAFIDSSCYLNADKIEQQVLLMECSKNILTYTSYYKNKNYNNELIDIGFYNWQVDSLSKEALNINLNTVMIDKSAIVKNNILFNENINCAADIIFIMDLLKLGYPLGIREPLVSINIFESDEVCKKKNIIEYLLDKNEISISDESIDDYINIIYDDKKSISSKQQRLLDLERYKYYLTSEYIFAKKIRNIKNRLLHREDYFSYNKSMDTISNGRLISLYKKTSRVFKRKNGDN